jgi:hypothetical protein
MVTKQDFIKKIKTKYPDYNNIDDSILFDKIITKYPQYKEQITDLPTDKSKQLDKQPSDIVSQVSETLGTKNLKQAISSAQKKDIKGAVEQALTAYSKMLFPFNKAAQELVQGGMKGASLGYVSPIEKETPLSKVGEFGGQFAPYMAGTGAVGAIASMPKIAQLAAKSPALANIIKAALPMAAVGAARPAETGKERVKQALFEGTVGAVAQGTGELGKKIAPKASEVTAKILSKTTGIPEDKVFLAISDTTNVFKQRGKQVWDKLAKNLKTGNEIIGKRAGLEIQDSIANAPKLSKVSYNYQQTKDNILQTVAEKQAKWLGADRMSASEKETLNKLYQMLESPEGRFGDKITFSKLHQAKKLLDDNLTFAQSNRLNPAPTEGEKLLKGIRNLINTQLGRDAKTIPEVANYVKANKIYSLYKEKLAPIKKLIEDTSMSLPQKLKSLENKSEELQAAVRAFDRLLPKKYQIGKTLKQAEAAKAFEPFIRPGAGVPSTLGGVGIGAGTVLSPSLGVPLAMLGATTSPALVGAGLRGTAALSSLLKGIPPTSKAIVPILQNMSQQ